MRTSPSSLLQLPLNLPDAQPSSTGSTSATSIPKLASENWGASFDEFRTGSRQQGTLLLHGDALDVLKDMPAGSVDFIMTSPPYWGQRQYTNQGIGLEASHIDYLNDLVAIFAEVHRVLKSTGSFWLNIGDTYYQKSLLGIPWRLAFRLVDEQGWILRNEVIWNKLKGGMDTSKDRLANTHEQLFHFVKQAQGYYYNVDAIRSSPRKSKIVNGSIVSATGVTGVRYKRQIELSTALTEKEKVDAFAALEKMIKSIAEGEYSDFRMVIRKQQRTTHSNQTKVSGRAKELEQKGFYFLRYHPKGSKPSDVWDIIPEDSQGRGDSHSAVYPLDLCRIPLLSTCPPNGIALDPFCGSGTTLLAARNLECRAVGIDISNDYLMEASKRLRTVK